MSGYKWEAVNSNDLTDVVRGEADTLDEAKADAGKGHSFIGRGAVTMIKGPKGTIWIYRTKEKTSGMKWERS